MPAWRVWARAWGVGGWGGAGVCGAVPGVGAVCGWCGRPSRRCREIARLRGKSPKLRGSRHQVCPAGTPKEGYPFRGCSGGLIMLASAWERKESPVARGRDRAGRSWVDCWASARAVRGQCEGSARAVRGQWGETVRGDCDECVGLAQTQPRKMITRDLLRPSHLSLSKFVLSSRQAVCGVLAGGVVCVWCTGGRAVRKSPSR